MELGFIMSTLDPQASNLTIPDRPKTLVRSSSVEGYSYDSQTYQLDVWYKPNKLYRYYLAYPNLISSIFDTPGSVGAKARNGLKGLRHIRLR
jgi:hypothetical protein